MQAVNDAACHPGKKACIITKLLNLGQLSKLVFPAESAAAAQAEAVIVNPSGKPSRALYYLSNFWQPDRPSDASTPFAAVPPAIHFSHAAIAETARPEGARARLFTLARF